jgi:flagellar hook-associated protein FlgK
MAQEIGALLDQIEALPTTATSAQDFSTKLAPLRDQVQTLQESVEQTEAPEELSSQRDQLANRLRSLRTQLGRVEGLLANDDLETAKTATEQLISVQQLRATIAAIEAASGGG